MSIIDTLKQRSAKRKARIIPTVDRERYQLEGSFFDPEKLLEVERKKNMAPVSGKPSEPLSVDTGGTSLVQQRDAGKRQRIFVVAAGIVLLVFGLKIWGSFEWGIPQMLAVATASSVLTYVGLMWAFRFDINRKGYLTVLPQPALFVIGHVLFVELFFFGRFQRIYEALLFGILLAVFLGGLILSFLTANVLNVATIKKIPLLQVAHTVSYMITLITSFFISYFVISLGINIYATAAILFGMYVVASYLHLSHFDLKPHQVSRYAYAIALAASTIAFVLMLWPIDTMFRVLMPTIAVYIGIGLVMHDTKQMLRPLINWEYVFVLLLVLAIVFLNSTWGISGKAWM